jgi:polyphosphate kinase 2 (PPK2 family)
LTKQDGEELRLLGVELLAEYQERLAAQDTYGLVVVLQGIDAAGKDGTIRHVMSGVNPQGVAVHSFKTPSDEELNRDFMWRYASHLPGRGEIGIFNRSRYREINDWERYLVDNGFPIVKLFLNLSREEQRRRFLARIDSPEKNWKFSAADVSERAYWDDYQIAFSEMLTHTSTAWAPWYVIPSDHKWFAHIAVGAVLVHTLLELDPRYPTAKPEAVHALRDARAELERQAPADAAARSWSCSLTPASCSRS